MELVDVVPGGFAGFPVDGDAVPNLILNNQHTDLLHLLAQLFDVVADKAIVHIHITNHRKTSEVHNRSMYVFTACTI